TTCRPVDPRRRRRCALRAACERLVPAAPPWVAGPGSTCLTVATLIQPPPAAQRPKLHQSKNEDGGDKHGGHGGRQPDLVGICEDVLPDAIDDCRRRIARSAGRHDQGGVEYLESPDRRHDEREEQYPPQQGQRQMPEARQWPGPIERRSLVQLLRQADEGGDEEDRP